MNNKMIVVNKLMSHQKQDKYNMKFKKNRNNQKKK